ncbi:hypothetical protein HMPREF0043_00159, partial [Actinobaculum sp. oral taxon 183 str. F0552]
MTILPDQGHEEDTRDQSREKRRKQPERRIDDHGDDKDDEQHESRSPRQSAQPSTGRLTPIPVKDRLDSLLTTRTTTHCFPPSDRRPRRELRPLPVRRPAPPGQPGPHHPQLRTHREPDPTETDHHQARTRPRNPTRAQTTHPPAPTTQATRKTLEGPHCRPAAHSTPEQAPSPQP